MVTHVDEISTPPTPADTPVVFEQRASQVWSDLARAVPQMNEQAQQNNAAAQVADAAKVRAIAEADTAMGYRNEAVAARDSAQAAAQTASEAAIDAQVVKDSLLDAQKRTQLHFATLAEASAAASTLPDGQEVFAPNESGVRARWRVQSGALSFIENDLRHDITSLSPDFGANLVGGIIAKSMTINVPAQHSTIQDAMEYLRGFTIARNAIVTIKVADGDHTVTSSTLLNHPEALLRKSSLKRATPNPAVAMARPPSEDGPVL